MGRFLEILARLAVFGSRWYWIGSRCGDSLIADRGVHDPVIQKQSSSNESEAITMTVEIKTQRASAEDAAIFLRRALVGNALFSALTGAVCVVFARELTRLTGIAPDAIIMGLGVALLVFAALVAWAALRAPDIRPYGRLIFGADVAWVAISAALLVTGLTPLTNAGVWVVILIADMVAFFALLEYLGLRRLRTAK